MYSRIICLLVFLFSLMVLPLSVLAAQGDVDASFGTEGLVLTDINSGADSLSSIAIQADGKILAVGSLNTSNDSVVVRYNSTGTLDTSFAGNGKFTVVSSSVDLSKGLALQPGINPKIIVIGQSLFGGDYDFAISRYNSAGGVDSSFGGGGLVETNFGAGTDDVAHAVAIQGDNKIVVAGVTSSGADTDFAVARYNSTGVLDSSFAVGGILTTDINVSSEDSAHDLFILDGKILVAGSSNGDFTIARYNSAGVLDTNFDDDGIVTTDFGGTEEGWSLAADSDGNILVAGTSNVGGDNDFAIARYNSAGVLDTNFGVDGLVISDFGGDDQSFDLVIQKDGKIVLAGYSDISGARDFVVARYNTSGNLDTSFGTEGKLIYDINTSTDEFRSLGLLNDGRIIAAGTTNSDGTSDFALARIDAYDYASRPSQIFLPTGTNTSGKIQVSWFDSATPGVVYVLESSYSIDDGDTPGEEDAADTWSSWGEIRQTTENYANLYDLPGGLHRFRVKAVKRLSAPYYHDSAYLASISVPVTLKVAAPFGIYLPTGPNTTGSIQVSWTKSTTPDVLYSLEGSYSVDGLPGSFTPFSGVTQTALNYANITGLVDGFYLYRVHATKTGYLASSYKATGTETEGLFEVALDTQAKAPKKIFLTSNNYDSGLIQVSWFETKAFGANYNLEVSSDGGNNWGPVAQYTDVFLNYANVSLTEGNYQFRVRANATGLSPSSWTYSSSVSIWLFVDTPKKIFVTKPRAGRAQVSWIKSTTPDVTFVLEESTDGGNIWSAVLEYTDTALNYVDVTSSGATIFRVKAVKGGYGDSSWSESKSVLF